MLLNPNKLACEEAILLLERNKRYRMQACQDLKQLRLLWEIDSQAYQDCSLSFERFCLWWERYEFGSRILVDEDNCILASIGIYPISSTQYRSFVNGQIPESDLLPVPLHKCQSRPQSYWYASGIVIAEEIRGWGGPLRTLLRMGLSHWFGSRHIAYPVHLAAIAEYEVGAKLLDFLGFQKTADKESMPNHCDLYQVCFSSEMQLRTEINSRLN